MLACKMSRVETPLTTRRSWEDSQNFSLWNLTWSLKLGSHSEWICEPLEKYLESLCSHSAGCVPVTFLELLPAATGAMVYSPQAYHYRPIAGANRLSVIQAWGCSYTFLLVFISCNLDSAYNHTVYKKNVKLCKFYPNNTINAAVSTY